MIATAAPISVRSSKGKITPASSASSSTSSAPSSAASAPSAPPAPPTGSEPVRWIPLEQIERDERNPRIGSPADESKIRLLAESMKSHGQQQPVQVMPYPKHLNGAGSQHKGQKYLLVFGFRRCAAAELNGWRQIAAIVKVMPLLADGSIDRLAIERLRGIENLQRQDLNPIEECLLIEQLAQNLPASLNQEGNPSRAEDGQLTEAAIQHLAYSIGRPESWVRDRLYLSRLSPDLKQKVMEGRLMLIYARQIAKLADHREQEAVAGMCLSSADDGHCHVSIHQVRRYVAERQLSLRSVPWRLDQPFPKSKHIVGPCSSCLFNSSNDPKLFEHDDAKGDGSSAPEGFCLKSSCFEAKRLVTDKTAEQAAAKLVKLQKPATDKSAEEVAPAFVKPSRVARLARRQMNGEPQSQKPKKLPYWETPEYKAKVAFAEAERNWRQRGCSALAATMKSTPRRLAALLLLWASDAISWQMSAKQVKKVRELLKRTVKAKDEDVLQLEKKLLGQKDFSLESALRLGHDETMIQELAKLYGVEIQPYPKLEQFLPMAAGEEAEGSTGDQATPATHEPEESSSR